MRRTLAVSMLVGIGLLVGCSTKTPGQATAQDLAVATTTAEQPPASSAPAAPASPNEPCALLTGESVGEELDLSAVTGESLPEETGEAGAEIYICEYTGSGALPVGALTVSVYQDNGLGSKATIDAIKEGYTAPKNVPGVGEAAATFEDEDARYLASAKAVADKQLMVMWVGPNHFDVERLAAMVKLVMDQL